MFVIALISAMFIPTLGKAINVARPVRVAVSFLVASELIGIFPRAYITNAGLSGFVGPSSEAWIPTAMAMITIYNFCVAAGLTFGHFVTLRLASLRGGMMSFSKQNSKSPSEAHVKKSLLFASLLCSIPGIILLFSHHHTFLNDPNISIDRGAVSGIGPQVLIAAIPYTALVIWYSFVRGKVNLIWGAILVLLFGMSLLGGSRSQTLDYVIVLLVIRFLQTGRKIKGFTLVCLGILGFILLYVGSIVSYARGMMRAFGGTLWMWAGMALQINPIKTWLGLLQTSFNGYDGLVSVVGTVPTSYPYQAGTLYYQMATVLIPRAIWHGKWASDLVAQFTHVVWGWGAGAGETFITGIGAMYLDGGVRGVVFGSLLLGMFTSGLGTLYHRSHTNHHWIKTILFACWCFFLTRFTFAGSPIDFDFAASIAVESIIVLAVSRAIRHRARSSASLLSTGSADRMALDTSDSGV